MNKKIYVLIIALASVMIGGAHFVHAAVPPPSGLPITLDIVESWVDRIFGFLLAVGFAIALIMIIVSGIRWATAGENPTKVQAAQGSLRSAIFGLLVILGLGVIYATIRAILNRTFFF